MITVSGAITAGKNYNLFLKANKQKNKTFIIETKNNKMPSFGKNTAKDRYLFPIKQSTTIL